MEAASYRSHLSEAPPRSRAVLKHASEWRQLAIVTAYLALMLTPVFVPAARNIGVVAAACWFGFLNSIVIHNHLHQGIFHSRRLNNLFRCVISFGSLYPASANIPSHNLVHHHFEDEGLPDWAAPERVSFRWNFLNLLHFPNVAGPTTFAGVSSWALGAGRSEFRRQYRTELAFAFGLTLLLLAYDPWATLFFVVIPQLYGARCILRINLIQHDGCDTSSEWNHSRNFVGRALNWVMCNNGYHTIHHNRAGLHWSTLAQAHVREVVPRIDRRLDEASMVLYLLRTFGWPGRRRDLREAARAERLGPPSTLESREVRRRTVEQTAATEAGVSVSA